MPSLIDYHISLLFPDQPLQTAGRRGVQKDNRTSDGPKGWLHSMYPCIPNSPCRRPDAGQSRRSTGRRTVPKDGCIPCNLVPLTAPVDGRTPGSRKEQPDVGRSQRIADKWLYSLNVTLISVVLIFFPHLTCQTAN